MFEEEEEDLGYAGPLVVGDVMGDVMGEYDFGPEVIGRTHRRRHHRRRGHHLQVHRPAWRERQLAPGVQAPDQGLLPLTLSGQGGTNTFSATVPTITFQGVLQKPFRGERLLVSVVRTGTTAVGRLLGQLFVGVDLQQLDVDAFDLEQVGTPQAFGVRLTMLPAQPGVIIKIVTSLSNALTDPDTIFASVTLLGRLVH